MQDVQLRSLVVTPGEGGMDQATLVLDQDGVPLEMTFAGQSTLSVNLHSSGYLFLSYTVRANERHVPLPPTRRNERSTE